MARLTIQTNANLNAIGYTLRRALRACGVDAEFVDSHGRPVPVIVLVRDRVIDPLKTKVVIRRSK